MGNLARSRSISLPAPVRGHGYHLGSPHNIVSRCCETRGELTIATILMRVAALLLLAVVLAECQSAANLPLSPLPEQLKLTSKVAHAKAVKETGTPKAPKVPRATKLGRAETPVEPVATNPPALGVKLLGEELRVVLIQERLRGLCEVEKAEQLSADSWRASCAKGDAFVVKVYPDGFMSVTRS
jgi:hypothetical protein